MFFTWNCTVCVLIERIEEISQVLFPSFTQFKTSFSLEERGACDRCSFSLSPSTIRPKAWCRCGTMYLRMSSVRGCLSYGTPGEIEEGSFISAGSSYSMRVSFFKPEIPRGRDKCPGCPCIVFLVRIGPVLNALAVLGTLQDNGVDLIETPGQIETAPTGREVDIDEMARVHESPCSVKSAYRKLMRE